MSLRATLFLAIAVLSSSSCGSAEEQAPVVQKSDALETNADLSADLSADPGITSKVVEGLTYNQAVLDVGTLSKTSVTTTFDPYETRISSRITNKCSFLQEVCLYLGYPSSTCRNVRLSCIEKELKASIR